MKNMNYFRILFLMILMVSSACIKLYCQDIKNPTDNLITQPDNEGLKKAKLHLAGLLDNNKTIIKVIVDNVYNNTAFTLGSPSEVLLFEDRVEMYFKNNKGVTFHTVIIYFSDILEYRIKTQSIKSRTDYGALITEIHLKLGIVSIVMNLENNNTMELMSDLLNFIKTTLNEERFNMAKFESIAAQYQSLKEKPSISEEQRKYIVQANAFTRLLQYDKAIILYHKAIELNPISYPEAYLNMALLSGQTNRFYAAIDFMKKFLLLEPEISDVKMAQEKIKDWEIKINN